MYDVEAKDPTVDGSGFDPTGDVVTRTRNRIVLARVYAPLLVAFLVPLGAPEAQSSRVVGTITATLDGEERTWYVLAGSDAEGPLSTAYWVDYGAGPLAMITGADIEDLDLVRPQAGGLGVDLEEYDGSVLSISFPVGPPGPKTVAEYDDFTVAYIPRFDDPDTMYLMMEGTLDLTLNETDGAGVWRFGGRIPSVTLEPVGSAAGSVRLEDCRFEVEEAVEEAYFLPTPGSE